MIYIIYIHFLQLNTKFFLFNLAATSVKMAPLDKRRCLELHILQAEKTMDLQDTILGLESRFFLNLWNTFKKRNTILKITTFFHS